MSWNAQALFDLLPAAHRSRDAEQGYPLRQFLTVLAEQARILEEDVEQLYDNAFVETCADWVLPYIGDLIGYRTIHGAAAVKNRRVEIANTIALRRRKGTIVMLEELARDATGWPSHAKEFFQILKTNQHMNHARLFNAASPDLRRWEPLDRLGSAFDTIAHRPEVGRIPIGEGRFNIRNIGLFLWRLRAYPVRVATAAALAGDARRFFFSPLGANAPLFNPPVPEGNIASLSGPLNVPEPIGRRRLADNLSDYYPRAMLIESDGVGVPFANVRACNLADAGGGLWAHAPDNVVAIDPVLGRISFPPNLAAPNTVLVTYHYGFSADMGGGTYERARSFLPDLAPLRLVPNGGAVQPVVTLAQAGGVVEISDSLDSHGRTVDRGERGSTRRTAGGERTAAGDRSGWRPDDHGRRGRGGHVERTDDRGRAHRDSVRRRQRPSPPASAPLHNHSGTKTQRRWNAGQSWRAVAGRRDREPGGRDRAVHHGSDSRGRDNATERNQFHYRRDSANVAGPGGGGRKWCGAGAAADRHHGHRQGQRQRHDAGVEHHP